MEPKTTKRIPLTHALNVVPFVGVEHMMRLVPQTGVERFLVELAAIEEDFRRWSAFDKYPRIAAHSRDGVIELMPTSDGKLYSFKYVNGHPKNARSRRQTVAAFGVLSNVGTGYPLLISEMTLLTALRTAATSALAARYLAPEDADTMAIMENGAQAEFQAIASKALLGIKRFQPFDIDPSASERCAWNLSKVGIGSVVCRSSEQAVEGAQVITTVTADKQNATILTGNMVGHGIHINAVGGDCPGKTELHRDILLRSSIFVEFEPQTRIEGEIQQLPPGHKVTELSDVIAGTAAGRSGPRDTTLFDSVGFAIEDFSASRYVQHLLDDPFSYQPLDSAWLWPFFRLGSTRFR